MSMNRFTVEETNLLSIYHEGSKAQLTENINAALPYMDADMREMLDSILGGGACAAIFGTMSVHALADGFPVWANLLLAVMDKMDESLVAEQKRMNPRMEKYRKKFGKYMKK